MFLRQRPTKAAVLGICLAAATWWSSGARASEVAVEPARVAVIPAPLSVTTGEGVFVLGPATVLRVGADDADARVAAGYLADLLEKTRGFRPVISADPGTPGDAAVTFRTGDLAREGYGLDVGEGGAVITAGDASGWLYGAVTLWQLATQDGATGPASINAVAIADAPRFGWRGVMLDSARHYQSPEFIKGFIDWMALHKLNVFHWHLTDDQAWRLEILAYPRLTEVSAWRVPQGAAARRDIDPATGQPRLHGGFYTQAQVREIVAYAAARGITVVPEVDVPGHASAAVFAYPELGVQDAPDSAVTAVPSDWGVYHTLFNTKPETIAFLTSVLDEVMDLFPGQYVHLGGDEAVKDQWKASPSIQAHMRALGITDEHAMQSWFMKQMEDHLTAHGRRLIGWDEILEGGLQGDATVMSWRGVEGAMEAARLGHDTVLSPGPTFYLDFRQSPNDGSPGRVRTSTLQDIHDFDPWAGMTPEQAEHVLGVQANIWTEHMRSEARVEYMTFPRIAALAELTWSAPGGDFAEFSQRLGPQLARYRSLGIDYAESALDTTVAPPPADGERRYDHQMTLCSNRLGLILIDDAPIEGERPSFVMDIFNPCWIYQQADLSQGVAFQAAVGQAPYNFQIGAARAEVVVRTPSTPDGELEVRVGGCDGEAVLTLPLEEAAKSDGVTVLTGVLPAMEGRHDLCLTFTQPGIDPMWGVDWVRLSRPGGDLAGS